MLSLIIKTEKIPIQECAIQCEFLPLQAHGGTRCVFHVTFTQEREIRVVQPLAMSPVCAARERQGGMGD